MGEQGREVVPMRWGLIPGWWKKSVREVPSTFNARAESVATKPMFRAAFKSRRCIVPASGFYEWTGAPGHRHPYLFTAADGAPVLAVAGLWDRWRDPGAGEDTLSCTIIVTGASAWMSAWHDRMPALLGPKDVGCWLEGRAGTDVLKPAPEDALRAWPVSPRLNRTGEGDDDPASIERWGAA